MPTTRPRHQVTETDEVARALDAAEQQWPGESRSRLLLRLIHEGARSVRHTVAETTEERRATWSRLSERYDGLYPSDYLQELRDDWPA